MSPTETWDDGNEISGDGCSSAWISEQGFQCTNVTTRTPATIWASVWGDGKRVGAEQWDDGNSISGDGCSKACTVEGEYTCTGGGINSKDTWFVIWGDGKSISTDPTVWDDGNNNPGDGCSADCKVENGFKWTRSSPTIPDIWTDIWGDGFKIKNEWDDGNLVDRDGWSSTWHLEVGFVCINGSPTRKDVCTEKWGDGRDYGKNECEDGNNIDGDGWNSNWEIEEWYACSGGTPFSIDTWYKYFILATIGEVSQSNSVVIYLNDTIINSNITQNDLLVSIESSYSVSFSWTASLQSSQSILSLNSNIE